MSTCIYAATESLNRKPADLFLPQHPIIHLLILLFSQVSQGVIAARKTSLLCEHTISFLPYKKALEPHGCTSVMEMGLCGRVWLIQNGLGEIMSLHKSPPGGSHLWATGHQLQNLANTISLVPLFYLFLLKLSRTEAFTLAYLENDPAFSCTSSCGQISNFWWGKRKWRNWGESSQAGGFVLAAWCCQRGGWFPQVPPNLLYFLKLSWQVGSDLFFPARKTNAGHTGTSPMCSVPTGIHTKFISECSEGCSGLCCWKRGGRTCWGWGRWDTILFQL